MPYSLDLDALTMAEIIRLQNQLSQTLKLRFEKHLALTIPKGQDTPIRAGTTVRLAKVLSLHFSAPRESLGSATVAVT